MEALRNDAAARRVPLIVSLLTDYGRDDFVGGCHGVIRTIPRRPTSSTSRTASRRYAVRQGARAAQHVRTCRWACTWRRGSPGGHERRAIARAPATAAFLVGPDNGLLSLAW